MARRSEPLDSLDDFPTPPFATRALCEEVLPQLGASLRGLHVHEPACNRGQMAEALKEYTRRVTAEDVFPYGYGGVRDFTDTMLDPYRREPNWIITNPPFNKAAAFLDRGLAVARDGVALLCRTSWLEGQARYAEIFSSNPPTAVAVFTERVPMFRARLDASSASATSYSWFVWLKGVEAPPRLLWVPPCRDRLKRPGDYVFPTEREAARRRDLRLGTPIFSGNAFA